MSEIAGETIKELEFIYESDAASSFLVIRCAGRVIEYQAAMLENNDIGYIIPVEMVKKENVSCFYCNITSQIPLSLYLKRNKLSKEAFLKLILNISVCIDNSAGYLLYPSNFLLKPEFIYVDPGTLDVMIVYIPAEFRQDDSGSLQTLVSELLMQHINEEDFCTGNLVQRILSEVKSEAFSIRGLMALINELLYKPDPKETPVPIYDREICMKTLEENREKYKIEEKKEVAENDRQKKSLYAVAVVALLQLVMGCVIYMCRGMIAGTGKDALANYAAVALIVLAIEVLIFRKLQVMKVFSVRDTGGEAQDRDCGKAAGQQDSDRRLETMGQITDQIRANRKGPKDYSSRQAVTADETMVLPSGAAGVHGRGPEKRSMAHSAASWLTGAGSSLPETDETPVDEKAACFTQKTEILGTRNEDEFVLVSRNRHTEDIVIDRNEFIVGRLAGHVDHILYNNAVGKLHAEFILRNGRCYVKDLNSMNGTFINGKRIESNKEILLKNNDDLRLANCEFIFRCGYDQEYDKPDNDKEAGKCMTDELCGMGSLLQENVLRSF